MEDGQSLICWSCGKKVAYDKNDLRPFLYCACGAATKNPNLKRERRPYYPPKYYPPKKHSWETFE